MAALPKRILVVDDSEVTRAILARTLRGAGFEVLEARDGVEGAVLALRERPVVVVTDLEMPTMDGFPLLRLLKADPASASIPVLILTSHGEAASRFWSARTGADAYLTKDRPPRELVETVARLAASAAPPAEALAGTASPMDVLARVARQLDAALLQATLVNSLLEHGMAAADFHEASRAALATVADVVDARYIAVAVGEQELALGHIYLPEPLPPSDLEALRARLIASLELAPGTTVEVQVSGERGGEPADLDLVVWVPLALRGSRGSRGSLALLPRDPQQFAIFSCTLVDALVGHLTLVLENARLSQRLLELSTLDGLTRLLNHRAIYDRLTEELERARRYRQPLSVVLCDFDNFKQVNDRFGHLAGDAVLRDGAAVLRRSLRGTDLLGRYGGEEFLAVLPQVDLEAGRQAAERLRRDLAANVVAVSGAGGPGEQRITGSFGVAALSELTGEVTADALVSVADRRLYEAKAAGRDRVRP